ncbi:MAG: PEGA domain-containing protein, partial [Gemmatimonadales bacterium]
AAAPRATVLRHRSARSSTKPVVWAVGGGLLALLVSVGGWLAFRPHGDAAERTATASEEAPTRSSASDLVADSVGPTSSPSPTPKPGATDSGRSTAASSAASSAAASAASPAGSTAPGAGAADSATLHFASVLPPNARLSVDGKARPIPPDGRLAVKPGTHSITVRAQGYRAGSVRIDIAAGETRELPLTLAPDSTVPVARAAPTPPNDSGASGETPPAAAAAPAAPPPAAAPPAPAPPAGATPGVIVVSGTLPPSAVLRVDGKPFPLGSRTATVPPGVHRVTLSAPNYPGDSTQLEIAPAQRAQWLVTYNGPGGQPDPGDEGSAPADAQAAPKVAQSAKPGAASGNAAKPAAPSAPPTGDAAVEAGARALIQAYVKAINAKDLNQLRLLYPGMPSDQERQWGDLFRDEVKDLSASVGDIRVVPGGVPQADFTLALTFRPQGSKPQAFRLSNHAILRPGGAVWQFDRVDQKGK